MKLKLNENSLLAMLLRWPWWVAALVAAAAIALIQIFVPIGFAIAASAPFIVVAVYRAWKQLSAPSEAQVAKKLDKLREMPLDEFEGALRVAYSQEGWTVTRVSGGQADLELDRHGRKILVACRRWKAGRTGIEPLRELDAVRKSRDAQGGIYVAAGEITEQARTFAKEKNIEILEGAALVEKLE